MKKLVCAIALVFVSACQKDEQQNNTAAAQSVEEQKAVEETTENSALSRKVEETKKVISEEGTIPTGEEAKAKIAQVKADLLSLSEDLSCDNNTQCYVLSTGSNPCGGASGYQVFSEKSADKASTEKLSSTLIGLEKGFHELEGIAGICQHLVKPQAMCADSKCVKVASEQAIY